MSEAKLNSNVLLVPCSKCAGTGQVTLPWELQETLAKVQNARAPITTDDLMGDLTRGAICNRLSTLETLGLIRRIGKRSKNILWTNDESLPPATNNQRGLDT